MRRDQLHALYALWLPGRSYKCSRHAEFHSNAMFATCILLHASRTYVSACTAHAYIAVNCNAARLISCPASMLAFEETVFFSKRGNSQSSIWLGLKPRTVLRLVSGQVKHCRVCSCMLAHKHTHRFAVSLVHALTDKSSIAECAFHAYAQTPIASPSLSLHVLHRTPTVRRKLVWGQLLGRSSNISKRF